LRDTVFLAAVQILASCMLIVAHARIGLFYVLADVVLIFLWKP
jgi:hypothetical protein